MTDNDVVRARVRLPDISPRAYEHPVDKGALAVLRAVPGVTEVLKAVAGAWPERGERLMALASCVRVGPTQYPWLEAIRQESAQILDLPKVPDVFVQRDPRANAMAIGLDQPFVIVTTDLIESLDQDAIRFVIAHEFGHVLSDHAVLRTLLVRLLSLQSLVAAIPAGMLGLRVVIAALREWFRKAELTADRAGLLGGQDPQAALRTHAYLAGATDLADIDLSAFLKQADEYQGTDDIRDTIHKFRNVEGMTHPLAVVRAAQLQRWAASPEYPAILAGEYPRRGDQKPNANFADDLAGVGRSYRDAAKDTTDSVVASLVTLGDQVGKAGSKAGEWLGKTFRGSNGGQTPTE